MQSLSKFKKLILLLNWIELDHHLMVVRKRVNKNIITREIIAKHAEIG